MTKQQIITLNERIAAAIAKANAETESLIAKYLAANPEATVENCTLIQKRLPDGTIQIWVEPIGRLAAFNAMEAALNKVVAEDEKEVEITTMRMLRMETREAVDDALALATQGR